VLDTVVVDETDLDNVPVVHPQRRVDHTLDIAADADERHLALGELGAEPIPDVGGILRRRALLGEFWRIRRRCRRARFSRLRKVIVSPRRCVRRVPRVGNCHCKDEHEHGQGVDR
jgi:hypothetical protein